MKWSKKASCWQQDITRKEWGLIIIRSLGITGVTAWLYYRSVFMILPLIPMFVWHMKMLAKELEKKKETQFLLQFKEAIQAISSALNTGYSVENAVREAKKELQLIYTEEDRISKELAVMVRKIRLQIPIEQIFQELADQVQTEDVRSFVTVFAAAKKSGGDMIAIIRSTVQQIGDKIDVKREIDTLLAAKKYEFRVMSVIPYGMIGYMNLSFSEFMDGLYGNALGIGVMSGCLAIYLGAYYLGFKMIEIEV